VEQGLVWGECQDLRKAKHIILGQTKNNNTKHKYIYTIKISTHKSSGNRWGEGSRRLANTKTVIRFRGGGERNYGGVTRSPRVRESAGAARLLHQPVSGSLLSAKRAVKERSRGKWCGVVGR